MMEPVQRLLYWLLVVLAALFILLSTIALLRSVGILERL